MLLEYIKYHRNRPILHRTYVCNWKYNPWYIANTSCMTLPQSNTKIVRCLCNNVVNFDHIIILSICACSNINKWMFVNLFTCLFSLYCDIKRSKQRNISVQLVAQCLGMVYKWVGGVGLESDVANISSLQYLLQVINFNYTSCVNFNYILMIFTNIKPR